MAAIPIDGMGPNERATISGAISNIEQVLSTGILSKEGANSPLFAASVVYVLIHLNDLLQKASRAGSRIVFSDDIDQREGAADVTDLISSARNAACHLGTPKADVEHVRFRFCTMVGRVPNAVVIDERVLGADYEDDVAVFYGAIRVYVNRHVIRAFAEVGDYFREQERVWRLAQIRLVDASFPGQ